MDKKLATMIVNIIGSGVIAAATVALIQVQYYKRVSEEDGYISKIDARIATCIDLANHHRVQSEIYEVEESPANLILVDDKYRPILDDFGENKMVAMSTNAERFAASIRMGRELVLCLALQTTFNDLKICVNNATYNQKSKRVLDDVTRENDQRKLGRWNPAC